MAAPSPDPGALRVAVACQGGGSHTAFTAGVLTRLLADERIEIAGLSGASGGAVCALLAWFGLANGGREHAAELLRGFWSDNAAASPEDAVLNAWLVSAARLESVVTLPAISPYAYPEFAEAQLRSLLARSVPPDELAATTGGPLLLIGAVDVLSGEFHVFSSARREISLDAVLASSAVPNLFRAVEIDGAAYWDGLFAQNPPVRDLAASGPEELWIVQVNPITRTTLPVTVSGIVDRRNELSGNMSLEQELFFIETINRLVREGVINDPRFRFINVRRLGLEHDLDLASKLDRTPVLLEALIAEGEREAQRFLDGLEGLNVLEGPPRRSSGS